MSDKILKLSQAQTLYQDLRGRIDALPTSSDIPNVPVQDIQINGTSILNNGVANIPTADDSTLGAVKESTRSMEGISIESDGSIQVVPATANNVKAGTASYRPIVPAMQHSSVFYGIAKAAGDSTQSASSNSVGIYTDAAKGAIQNMFGVTNLISTEEFSTATAAHALNSLFMMNGKLHRATAAIAIGDAVVVGTNCEVVKADEVFVKNTDYATTSTAGIIKIGARLEINTNNELLVKLASENNVKSGGSLSVVLTPARIDSAAFYGLSKVAGVDLANETVTLGTYPEASKTAIRTLIGAAAVSDIPSVPIQDVQIGGSSIVSNGIVTIPVRSNVVSGSNDLVTSNGIYNTLSGFFNITDSQIKGGTQNFKAIAPVIQHKAVFYGLAKAAGDSTQSSSDNAVGTYTNEAKAAIQSMLDVPSTSSVTSQISTAIGNVHQFELSIQQSLPTQDIDTHTIYLIPKTGETNDVYDEYVYINNGWEMIGNTQIDLSNYATKSELPTLTDLIDDTIGSGTTNKTWSADKIYDELDLKAPKANPVFTGSISLGRKANTTIGGSSFVVGSELTASGPYSCAFGLNSTASGQNAIAIGLGETSSGIASVAIGNETVSSGAYSFSVGNGTDASANSSAAIGKYNSYMVIYPAWTKNTSYNVGDRVSKGNAAFGFNGYECITANSDSSWTSSKWKMLTTNSDTIFVVGNGESSSVRSNALTLEWNGDLHLDGDVYVNANVDGTGGSKLATVSEIPSIPVTDIQVNGTSIVTSGVANVPIASSSNLGAVKIDGRGLNIQSSGLLYISKASSTQVKNGNQDYAPITPYNQHEATFYGLAKASGDATQSASSNPVGTYTDNAKASINSMIGSVSKKSFDDAGITDKTYTTKFGGEFSVTTVTTTGYISPYARASVTGRISKHYKHRVTFNGTEYILRTRLWYITDDQGLKVYEYLGNIGLFVSSTSGIPGGTDNVPFVIISDLNSSSSIDVLTQTAGTYTIKVEQINENKKDLPKSLIWSDEYSPIEKNNNDGTYNGHSIGVNELNNTRGTFAIGYGNKIDEQFSYAIGNENIVERGYGIGTHNNVVDGGYAFGDLNAAHGGISIGVANSAETGGIAIGSVVNSKKGVIVVGKNNSNIATVSFPSWEPNKQYYVGDIVSASVFDGDPPFPFICKVQHTSSNSFMTDFAGGKWNLRANLETNEVFIVGNGIVPEEKSNGLSVGYDGDVRVRRNIYVDCNADSTGGTLLPKDIQVNGTSVVTNGVANVPIASSSQYGVVKINNTYGLNMATVGSESIIVVQGASNDNIKAGISAYRPIVAEKQHQSVFYGLAKAAGDTTQSSSSNAVGVYTESAKTAIRSMIGATSSNIVAVQDTQPTETDSKIWMMETAPEDIVVPSYAEFQALDAAVVKKTDIATSSTAGIVKINSGFGIYLYEDQLRIYRPTDAQIKAGNNNTCPITPSQQDISVFYGLAKAAGDSTQAASDNTVGTYTTTASAAIRTMLGAVGTTQYATASTPGVVKIGSGITMVDGVNIAVSPADSNDIKGGTVARCPIAPLRQHEAVFYGLAKAAGDSTQSASSNTVGTYTSDAKEAIQEMLGAQAAIEVIRL